MKTEKGWEEVKGRKSVRGRGDSQCKGPGVELWFVSLRNSEEADGVEQSEGEGRVGDEVDQTREARPCRTLCLC